MKSSILFKFLLVVLLVLTLFAIIPYLNVGKFLGYPASTLSSPIPSPTPRVRVRASINVSGIRWGRSTCYIGAVEGSSRFNIADLQDLGINTYHLYGGTARWEPQDDDGIYGYPSIEQIKANPNIINWSWWDNIMTHPPEGSDYWWDPKMPRWQGTARTLFSALKAARIRTVISLRNRDDQGNPAWAPNPPVSTADWNEWWEHVFALVYWLNVRNNYDINDFEVHNEPEIRSQGWGGNQFQYFEFVKYTHDAIDYVYRTYLPGRTYHIYAPAASRGNWPNDAIRSIPQFFDSMDVHIYRTNISSYIEQVHGWMNAAGHPHYPLWLTEWGSHTNEYNSVAFGITLINNLIYGSRPGNDYVYGSQIFTLYDFDTTPTGLISYNGMRRVDYYAMRMAIRALQGCRPTYRSVTSDNALLAITTRDVAGNIDLLVTNQSTTTWYDIDANLSSLLSNDRGIMQQFDAGHMDTMSGSPVLENGHVTFTIPADGAILITFPQASHS